MSTILFITDLSDQSKNVLNYALHFADRIRAKIVFLYCPQKGIDRKVQADNLQENTQKIYALRMQAAEFAFKNNCQIVTDYLYEEEPLESCLYSVEKKVNPEFSLIGIDFNQAAQKENNESIFKLISRITTPIILIPSQLDFIGWQGIAFIDQQNNEDSFRLKQVLLLSHLFNSRLYYFDAQLQDTKPDLRNKQKKEQLILEAIKNDKLIHMESNKLVDQLQRLIEQNEIQLFCISNNSMHYEKVVESYLRNENGLPPVPMIIYQDKL